MQWFQTSFLPLVLIAGLSLYLVTGEIRVITHELPVITDPGVPPGLNADFSAAPTSGRFPLMVQFIDLSNGNPVRWSWDFGDGETSREKDPIHTYTRGGQFTVGLEILDGAGKTDTEVKERYITARPVPLAAGFTADPMSGRVPLTVRFTDESVGAMVWLWNFGDGSTGSMVPNPSHTYTQAGTYQARLTVSNQLGESDTHAEIINVTSPDQVMAGFVGLPTSGTAPLSVQFTDQSTGPVTGWIWDFGDGITGNTQNPVHTYMKSGMYSVTLTVVSGDDSSDTRKMVNYISITEPQPTGSIALSPGWNFVSVPGELEPGKDTALIFQDVEVDGHSVFQYSQAAGGWLSLTKSSPVCPLEAYWIYSKKNDMVPLCFHQGTGSSPSRTLGKGWNSVGFTGFVPVEANRALSPVKDTWEYCIGYNREEQHYDEMIIKNVNDSVMVHPYSGYWVYMNGEGVLSTPVL